ncbi:uncharacterized protein LOC126440367 [Schistocerca serialis cubense]|uniref:uncharacterized protein LOC126440367 n=1 Tax=Schistocerca serialis cubense TaxID=2023355 RepID=UPI00214E0283|nr:uncharacterized protein LOC126440367 [Schistocerca serialis cubense]
MDMDTPAVSRLAVRLPTFWPHNPMLWFTQLEASFMHAGITAETTKFPLDIITAPPTEDAYEWLKTELICCLAISQEDRIRQVLTQEEIGDRKPLLFLHHLRSTEDPGTIPDSILHTLWSSHLPPQVKAVIGTQNETSLDTVAELADCILEAITPNTHVSVVDITVSAAAASTMVSWADYDALTAKVNLLCTQLSKLMSNGINVNQRSHSR